MEFWPSCLPTTNTAQICECSCVAKKKRKCEERRCKICHCRHLCVLGFFSDDLKRGTSRFPFHPCWKCHQQTFKNKGRPFTQNLGSILHKTFGTLWCRNAALYTFYCHYFVFLGFWGFCLFLFVSALVCFLCFCVICGKNWKPINIFHTKEEDRL